MYKLDQSTVRPSTFAHRLAALAVLAAVPAALHAQKSESADSASTSDLFASVNQPFDLAKTSDIGYSSSSSSDDSTAAVDAARLNVASDSMQPPPRRRYGRPRYNDSSHNSDGSSKYAFVVGAGITLPSGNTLKYDTPSYAFQVGGGRNFNKNFGLMLQFDYDNFGLQGSTLANQTTVYNYGVASADQISGLDGNAHVWSFTLNPVYTLYSGEGLGAYVVGGVGFYHKVTNFTVPATGTYCDPYYGYCYQYSANEIIDHYTSNAPGVNAGFGLTYKPSRFANERLFAEIRYVIVLNSQRQGQSVYNITDTNTNNYYPANSNRTAYFPVKAGIRF